MFVDVYSLGRGGVFAIEDFCKFAINNLQVLRGYRLEKIPEPARLKACGPHGLWKPGDPAPMLEIVPHHESPVVYPKIPEQWRTPHFQAAGTARKMVRVTNPIEKAMLGGEGWTLDMQVASPPRLTTPSLEDVLPGLVERVASPDLSVRPQQPELIRPTPPPPPSAAARHEVVEAAMDAANGRCQGKTGAGTGCPRRARPGRLYCGAHDRKEVLS